MREARLGNGDRIKIGPTIFKFLSGQDVEAQYHEEIYRMTIIDGLTQAHVKRYLLEALDKEIIRARRHMRDLSFLMLDIDHFKKINDVHGHLAGDYVLKEVARIVQQRIRRDEVFARYGGEEFAIILPETTLEGARALAEGLREKVEQSRFVFQSETIRVTISIGVRDAASTDRPHEPRPHQAGRREALRSQARRPQPRRLSARRDASSPACQHACPTMRVAPPGPRSRELAARLAAVESPAVDARREARALESGDGAGAHRLRARARARTSSTSTATGTSISPRASARCCSGTRPPRVARGRRGARANARGSRSATSTRAEAKVALCERLARLFPEPGARVMLGSSGADAVTAALKTAVLATGQAPASSRSRAPTTGCRTGRSPRAGSRPSFREPFAAQLNPHVTFAPVPRDETLERRRSSCSRARAAPPATWARCSSSRSSGEAAASCRRRGSSRGSAMRATSRARCSCADEIWTGLGRSGRMALRASSEGVVARRRVPRQGARRRACRSAPASVRASVMAAWGAHGGDDASTRRRTSVRRSRAPLRSRRSTPSTQGSSPERARDGRGALDGAAPVATAGRGVREVRGPRAHGGRRARGRGGPRARRHARGCWRAARSCSRAARRATC